MCSLAWIPLNRNGDFLVRRKMPHYVDDVASILGTKLDTKLTPDLLLAVGKPENPGAGCESTEI